ncbi:MAG: TFIIB-type zinc ribbon-containing protein [Candidatus Bathyarchaeia archaeon]
MSALTGTALLKLMFERLSRDQLSELAAQLGLCLECGGSLIHSNGEVVCAKCGLVWLEEIEEARIPFPEFDDPGDKDGAGGHYEAHWNPECSLAFGRNLGSSLTSRDLERILGRRGQADRLGF